MKKEPKKKGRRSGVLLVAGVLLAVLQLAALVGYNPDNAESVTKYKLEKYDQTYYNRSHKLGVHGRAYGKNWACGLKDCANVRNVTGSGYLTVPVNQTSYVPDAMKIRLSTEFSGSQFDVTLGKGGARVGFSDWGKACGTGWFDSNTYYVKYVSSDVEVCKAKSSIFGWISKVKLTSEVGYRLWGFKWHSMWAIDEEKLGGF